MPGLPTMCSARWENAHHWQKLGHLQLCDNLSGGWRAVAGSTLTLVSAWYMPTDTGEDELTSTGGMQSHQQEACNA